MSELINHHKIQVSKTAEIITSGKLSEKTKEIWIVLHGYAQLPEYFIKNFDGLANAFIIAPSALSRAYVKGYNGRVGAIWMTSHERADEIEDYIKYLNKIADYFNLSKYANTTINLLGFSQGAATAGRFAAYTNLKIDRLILWGGILPIEIENNQRIKNMERNIVYGTQDEFILPQEELFKATIARYSLSGFEILRYKGKHRIPNNKFLKFHEENWS
jgi:predicted esterase